MGAISALIKQRYDGICYSDFNWDRAFLNTNVNKKVCVFSSTIMNILSNFIPHERTFVTIKIPHGLIKQSNLSFKNKRAHSKNTAKAKITSSYYNA